MRNGSSDNNRRKSSSFKRSKKKINTSKETKQEAQSEAVSQALGTDYGQSDSLKQWADGEIELRRGNSEKVFGHKGSLSGRNSRCDSQRDETAPGNSNSDTSAGHSRSVKMDKISNSSTPYPIPET